MYEIQDDVPVPMKGKGGMLMTTLDALQPGQSFFVDRRPNGVRQIVAKYGVRSGRTFTTRAEDSGLRIWRLK